FILSALGGGFGIVLAYWGIRLIIAGLPAQFPRVTEIGIDLNVLAFTIAIVVVAAFAFGVLPALKCSKADVDRALKEGSRSSTDTPWRRRFRATLAGGEIALATILVVGSLLLAKSFVRLIDTPLGLDTSNVIGARLNFSQSKYPNATARYTLLNDLRERVRLQPKVQSVTMSNMGSMAGTGMDEVRVESKPVEGRPPVHAFVEATSDYFRTLGIPFRLGRPFLDGEAGAVVTEMFAERYFAGMNPLGQRIQVVSRRQIPWYTIVGVVSDFRLAGLNREMEPIVILSSCETCRSLLVKTSSDPASTMRAIRTELAALDKDLVVDLTTLDQSLDSSQAIAQPRFRTTVLGAFAAVALLLALVGVFGVTSYSAAQRTQEVGIRLALGASRTEIVSLMTRQSLLPSVIGVVAGIVGASALTRLIKGYLFEVSPVDPAVLAAAVLLLIISGFVAALIPIRRATSIDPVTALRYE
ncbi:MAG: ABC transporter permease, partial [Acidobacteria bacterium]|nr:ABC transporter permease [Acidobacteriota bacterium]